MGTDEQRDALFKWKYEDSNVECRIQNNQKVEKYNGMGN